MAFFSLPEIRRYHYKPWFYNADEEKRRERRQKIEREVKQEQGEQTEAPNFIHFARKERQKSNRRVLVIFLFLAAAYYFLQHHFLS